MSDEDGQAIFVDQIEQPRRGHMVGSNRVCPERLHLRQIIRDAAPGVGNGCPSASGQTDHKSDPGDESLFTMSKPLPVDAHSTVTAAGRHIGDGLAILSICSRVRMPMRLKRFYQDRRLMG